MNDNQNTTNGMRQETPAADGMPIVGTVDVEALAKEKAYLESLSGKSTLTRFGGYLKLSGPGWIQSALTLGGGSGSLSLFAGALAGYALIWVNPLSMLFGVIMMGAMAYMTLSTGIRPFKAVNEYAHPILGWGWVLATLFANFIWIFGQFNVSSSVVGNIFTYGGSYAPDSMVQFGRFFFGNDLTSGDAANNAFGALACLVIAPLCLWVALHYGKGSRGVHWFENAMKLMVAGIILCFAIVVFKTDTDWLGVIQGMFSFKMPSLHGLMEKDKLDVVISAFSAAVGINMTFVFPYTLLARGWGREHRGLCGFDLSFGMFIPFVFAVSCLTIAAGNTLYKDQFPRVCVKVSTIQTNNELTQAQKDEQIDEAKKTLRNAVSMSQSLEPMLGRRYSHIVFGLGFLGMTTSSIVTMMLVSGFALCEVCGGRAGGTAFKIGACIPALGMFGPLVFGKMQMWLMVPISVFCFFFIPIAYITFFVLMNNRRFLGDDMPRGVKRLIWNTGMLIAIVVVTAGGAYKLVAIFSS